MSERSGRDLHWLRGAVVLAPLLIMLSACAGSTPTGGGPPTVSPTGAPKSVPALELAVLSAVGGRLDYCDPDEYPVPHGSPVENARARIPVIEQDRAAFAAILEHEHLRAGQQFTDDQLIAINDDYKQMQAIELQRVGDDYAFSVLVPDTNSNTGNERVNGTVKRSGQVEIKARGPGEPVNCPICLAADVRIATPFGDVAVQDIRTGMAVWTTDLKGQRTIGVVLRTGRTQAPLGHRVVRITLGDGRTLLASPGHPTADGRTIGALMRGDRLDGSRVVAAVLVSYSGAATFDLLPSGPTGTYFANGVLLGSSLSERGGSRFKRNYSAASTSGAGRRSGTDGRWAR